MLPKVPFAWAKECRAFPSLKANLSLAIKTVPLVPRDMLQSPSFTVPVFIGMRPDTTRKDMTLAVLEGVAFALKDCLEAAAESGTRVTKTKICGGGAKSPLWRKIIANVCNVTVETPAVEQGPAYGAAMLKGRGCRNT